MRDAKSHHNEDGSVKRRYATRTDAKHDSKRVTLSIGHKMYIYQCDECGGYHLSKSPERKEPQW